MVRFDENSLSLHPARSTEKALPRTTYRFAFYAFQKFLAANCIVEDDTVAAELPELQVLRSGHVAGCRLKLFSPNWTTYCPHQSI